jgi:hypothetical protein
LNSGSGSACVKEVYSIYICGAHTITITIYEPSRRSESGMYYGKLGLIYFVVYVPGSGSINPEPKSPSPNPKMNLKYSAESKSGKW